MVSVPINYIKLKNEEEVISVLGLLYQQHGYSQYKMNKFEEYDLYADNKDFLISENVITFTDMNGKLVALKPDVTLSIVKNSERHPTGVKKLYYNENVYRISDNTNSFREIMQTGLECYGRIDTYCIFEVLLLAAKSLEKISDDCILSISHLMIITKLLKYCSIPEDYQNEAIEFINRKNGHGLEALCDEIGITDEKKKLLKQLIYAGGAPEDILPALKNLSIDDEYSAAVSELDAVTSMLRTAGCGNIVRLNFSTLNNLNYYDGIVFKGFINGISSDVLSGGQYSGLMQKMHKESKAIGFAVYLDMLENMFPPEPDIETDIVITYDSGTDLTELCSAVTEYTEKGISVSVCAGVPPHLSYKKHINLCKEKED